MTDMTAAQKERVRAFSGDDTLPYEVSDALMQSLFEEEAGEDVSKTVVYVLRIRVAKAQRLVNETNEAQVQKSSSQKFDHLKDMLAQWEERTGLDGGAITLSTLDLGLDSSCDDTTYRRPWWGGW